ncbi:MAG: hypothetical protein EPN86_03605 [Nanoarchaeota archaeon]|nr:MAG: hypothetical protein EPN86_03605 [Nanoarchaeota archaeon]
MVELSEIVEVERRRVFGYLKKERGEKYSRLIRGLSLAAIPLTFQTHGNIIEARRRARLLTNFYVLMRSVDDVVDGDLPRPEGVASLADYVRQRIGVVKGNPPSDNADYLYYYCQSLAGKLGFTIDKETISIYESLLFDAQRRDWASVHEELRFYTEHELSEYFHLRDIQGTISGMLKVFGDDPRKAKSLEYAGMADRVKLTLLDLPQDIAAGLVNIPSEEIVAYKITENDLQDAALLETRLLNGEAFMQLPDTIAHWALNQAKFGRNALDFQDEMLKGSSFRTIGKLLLKYLYMRPSRKYFDEVIAQTP